jgi:DNA-binding NarL/FixJ family response regulator
VLDKVLHDDFHVLLLDISMPGKNWLDVINEIRVEKPQLAVLILSRHSEEEYAVRAFKAGVSGYLTKATVVDELIVAIRKVAAGRKYVSSALAEKLASSLRVDTLKTIFHLL